MIGRSRCPRKGVELEKEEILAATQFRAEAAEENLFDIQFKIFEICLSRRIPLNRRAISQIPFP